MYSEIVNRILIREEQILDKIKDNLTHERGANITYFGMHSFNVFDEDPEFRSIIENHFDVYSDGIGMYWLLKYLFSQKIEKFNASDLNENIFKFISASSQKAYIIGGKFPADIVREKLASDKISAVYSDGYDAVKNIDMLSASIEQSGAKIVIIGMGVPLQEKLAFQLFQKSPGRIYICVGGFLEFYFGTVPRIPAALRNKGIEWLFRILIEPRRLSKRYFIGIPVFMYRTFRLFSLTGKNKSHSEVYSTEQ